MPEIRDAWAVPPPRSRATAALVVPALVGSAVAITLGVYGRVHEPSGIAVNVAGFSSPQTVKVWLATLAVVLAVVQFLSALVMYGKLSGPGRPAAAVHRWSGRLAFLSAVPVAVHCLYALGLQSQDTRILVHSVVGCVFFGAFTAKMLLLAKPGLAGWTLPLFGGLLFAGLVLIWSTSSLWFFTTVGVTF